jgi:hypothetical protein
MADHPTAVNGLDRAVVAVIGLVFLLAVIGAVASFMRQ